MDHEFKKIRLITTLLFYVLNLKKVINELIHNKIENKSRIMKKPLTLLSAVILSAVITAQSGNTGIPLKWKR